MKIYGVVMAGGEGTRFWPLSRKDTPKQLLNLSGKDIMVNETIDRLFRATEASDIFIVTSESQKKKMSEVLKGRVDDEHILCESVARNTAACIGYAAMVIEKKYGDGIMVINSSDAHIKNEKNFAKAIQSAVRAADETDMLVTVGIKPTFAATGYGYIQYKKCPDTAKPVLRFIEKPKKRTAKKYLKSGEFVWNSGMFVWRASTILRKMEQFLPEVYSVLVQISASFGKADEKECIAELYKKIPSVSIDCGILEKCKDILVVPGDFGWSDIGSWDTFNTLHKEDALGNILFGESVALDTERTTICSTGKLVATIGVKDLVIVATEDAVLVCAKDRAQDVKKVVDELQKRGKEEFL